LKAKKLLNAGTFRQTALNAPYLPERQADLARALLEDGAGKPAVFIKALADAKLAYVADALDLCSKFRCRAFASIVDRDAPDTTTDGLRKDYAYLFQRFFYFLEEQVPEPMGIVVFDELERVASHLLVDQCARYFRGTATGRARARLIVPEPFFVHSELTTGVQLADLVAYIVSWGVRFGPLTRPARPELASFAAQVERLRYRTKSPRDGQEHTIWSFAYITDLRTQSEKGQ
jgi:hypothetical protein